MRTSEAHRGTAMLVAACLLGSLLVALPGCGSPATAPSQDVRPAQDALILQEGECGIVFLGDSITDYFDYASEFATYGAQNQGIAGDTTTGVLNRLDSVVSARPRYVFIEIGVNDLTLHVEPTTVLENYGKIIQRLSSELPDSTIYVESIYPVSTQSAYAGYNQVIEQVNEQLELLCDGDRIVYLDIAGPLTNDPAMFKRDGVHLNDDGYRVVLGLIREVLPPVQ